MDAAKVVEKVPMLHERQLDELEAPAELENRPAAQLKQLAADVAPFVVE